MARFQVRLQKVLEARISLEDQAKREFGDAQRKLHEEKLVLEDLFAVTDSFRIEMAVRRREGSTVRQFRDDLQQDWMNKRRISDQKHRIKKSEEMVEKKRQKLVQAMKDRKVMEKLREKHYDEFVKDVRLEEMKFADDIAGIHAAHSEENIVGA